MTTVGALWRELSDDQRDRATAALRGVLHDTGTRLVLAITRAAHDGTPATHQRPADAYPYLFPTEPTPARPLHCHDCGTEVIVDPIPYWNPTIGHIVYLGSTCWRARMLAVDEQRTGRHEAPPLPIEAAAETNASGGAGCG